MMIEITWSVLKISSPVFSSDDRHSKWPRRINWGTASPFKFVGKRVSPCLSTTTHVAIIVRNEPTTYTCLRNNLRLELADVRLRSFAGLRGDGSAELETTTGIYNFGPCLHCVVNVSEWGSMWGMSGMTKIDKWRQHIQNWGECVYLLYWHD